MSAAPRRPTFAPAIFVAALAVLGCAPAQSLVMTPDEYAAYRATRIAPTFDERVAAAARYLDRFPNGTYAADVQRYFEEAEPVFYESKKDSAAGLEAYLKALPKSDRSEIVHADLRARRAARDEREEMRGVTSMGARLSALTAQRARVRTEVEAWVRRFLDADVWQRPIAESPPDLIVAWTLGLPPPVCSVPENAPPGHARRCSKILELPYTVTADGQPEERQATIEITIAQDAMGRPLQVSIGGPDLFLRLEETYSARAITPDDAAQKTSAATRAVDIVRNQVEQRLDPPADCRRPSASPILLHFACKGLRVTVRSAGRGGEDDMISILPL